jgi:hypothetical protein
LRQSRQKFSRVPAPVILSRGPRLRFVISFVFGIGCGLLFLLSFLGLSWRWGFLNYFGILFLGLLISATLKLRKITDNTDWVLPLWLGVGAGSIAGFIVHTAVQRSLNH